MTKQRLSTIVITDYTYRLCTYNILKLSDTSPEYNELNVIDCLLVLSQEQKQLMDPVWQKTTVSNLMQN